MGLAVAPGSLLRRSAPGAEGTIEKGLGVPLPSDSRPHLRTAEISPGDEEWLSTQASGSKVAAGGDRLFLVTGRPTGYLVTVLTRVKMMLATTWRLR
jgi:hypothetical protein